MPERQAAVSLGSPSTDDLATLIERATAARRAVGLPTPPTDETVADRLVEILDRTP